jgi:hypothetical protein
MVFRLTNLPEFLQRNTLTKKEKENENKSSPFIWQERSSIRRI